MIGIRAFLVETAVATFALAFGLWLLSRSIATIRTRWTIQAVLLGLFGVILGAMFLGPLLMHARVFRLLQNIKNSDVHSVTISENPIDDKEQIESFTADLHRARWFTGMHGGWGSERVLEINRTGGTAIRLRIARYPANGRGAVLLGRIELGHAYWSFDCCFIESPDPKWFRSTH